MKFLAILLIALICLTTLITSHKVNKNNKNNRSPKKTNKKASNSLKESNSSDNSENKSGLWNFGLGICNQLVGPHRASQCEQCIPKLWKVSNPESIDENTIQDFAVTEKAWGAMKTIMTDDVQLLCPAEELKNKAILFTAKKIANATERRRLFLDVKTKDDVWNYNELLDKDKSQLNRTAKRFRTGKIKLTKEGKKALGTQDIKIALRHVLNTVFKPMMDQFVLIKPNISLFFKSDVMFKTKLILNCIKKLYKPAIKHDMEKIELLKRSVENLKRVRNGESIICVELMFSFICDMDNSLSTITYLTDAVKITGPHRWNLIGRFTGKLLYMFGKANIFSTPKTRRLR